MSQNLKKRLIYIFGRLPKGELWRQWCIEGQAAALLSKSNKNWTIYHQIFHFGFYWMSYLIQLPPPSKHMSPSETKSWVRSCVKDYIRRLKFIKTNFFGYLLQIFNHFFYVRDKIKFQSTTVSIVKIVNNE